MDTLSLDTDVRLYANIKVPSDLQLSSQYLIYTKNSCETKEECVNLPYDVLQW